MKLFFDCANDAQGVRTQVVEVNQEDPTKTAEMKVSRRKPKPKARVSKKKAASRAYTHHTRYERTGFAKTVYAARRKKGLSQTELAKKMGVAQSTVSLIERGNTPTAAQRAALKKTLGIR